ncbi:hypothetical protein KKC44_04675 [Patescibacteria group bacterium]|nr:hypothetical protein [Patescibacteria group bacterium]MBU2259872.1 hypothetical protein [Patescibacteria group bacterium]
MNKALVSSVSLVLTLGVVAPAFAMASAGGPAFAMASAGGPAFAIASAGGPALAYVPNRAFERTSHRLEVEAIKATRDVRNTQQPARRGVRAAVRNRSVLQERAANSERSEVAVPTKNTHLERTTRAYNLRSENRQPKPGSDRYRVLRPNTRSLRKAIDNQSALPSIIVQTGFSSSYDRPTRRDIRDNGYYDGILNRDRDVLKEMRENQR